MAISSLHSHLPTVVRARELVGGAPTARVIEYLAAAGLVVAYATQVVPDSGGRTGSGLLVALVATTIAIVLARSWRELSRRATALLTWLSASAVAVALLAPTGSAGFRDVAFYLLPVLTYVFVHSFARTAARRTIVALAVCGLGLHQFAAGFPAWWGSGDPTTPMIGTFYWHNQFGAYMLAIALVAGTYAIFGHGIGARIGFVVAPVCGAAVVLSASRGCVLLLAAGWLASGVLAVVQRAGMRGAVLRWLVLGPAVFALGALLTSGLFFPAQKTSGALGGIDARNASTQTVGQNTRFRIDHFRAAGAVFIDNPVTGAGFQTYRYASSRHLYYGLTRAVYAHSGFLQAAADGGLLLLLPLLAAVCLAGWRMLRESVRSIRSIAAAPARTACTAGALALLAHAAVDVDWTYPALGALLGALLAVACFGPAERSLETVQPAWRTAVTAAAFPLIGAVAVLLVARFDAVSSVTRADSQDVAADARVRDLLRRNAGVTPDSRLLESALETAVPHDFAGTVRVDAATARRLLRDSAALGEVDAITQLRRAQLMSSLGEHDQAVRAARVVVDRESQQRPFLLAEYAETLMAANLPADARAVLVEAVADPRHAQVRSTEQLEGLTSVLDRLTAAYPDERASCSIARAREVVATRNPDHRDSRPSSTLPAGCEVAAQ